MKNFKKFLSLAVAMLLICCLPVGAAETIQKEVYVTAGSEYTLPDNLDGVAVTWDVDSVATDGLAKRLVKGTTEDGTPVELIVNVGINEPTLMNNFNDITSASITSHALDTVNGWAAGSKMKAYNYYETDATGNKYLRMTNDYSKEIGGHIGRYGIWYALANEEISGNISFETKIKIPKETGSYPVEFRFRPNCASPGQATYDDSVGKGNTLLYVMGKLSVEDGGYWYRDYRDTAPKTRYTTRVADYNEQWITLRWEFDTTNDSYVLYCNGEKMVTVEDAKFTANNDSHAIKYFQISTRDADDNFADCYFDDILVDYDTKDSANVLYYGDTTAPSTAITTREKSVSTLIPTTLVTEADGVETATDKSLGVIVEPLKEVLPGAFTTPLTAYETKEASWKVTGVNDVFNYTFEEDAEYVYNPAHPDAVGGSGIVEKLGTNVLYFKKDASASQSNMYEDFVCNIAEGVDAYEIEFDILLESIPAARSYFYMQFFNANNCVYQLLFDIRISGETYIKTNKLDLNNPANYNMISDTKMHKMKFLIDRKQGTVSAYRDGVYLTSQTFAATVLKENGLNVQLDKLRLYVNRDGIMSVGIDNFRVSTYADIASVNTDSVLGTTTVVRGQKPVLPAYVTTTLTDGNTSKLPVKWNAVNTSNAGEVTATGVVVGYTDATGAQIPVTTTVNVIPFPYSVAVQDGAVTVSILEGYAPAAQIYLAIYDETGALKDVTAPFVIDAETVWENGATTYTLTEAEAGASYRAFVWNAALKPLAE